jgi:hypothetical protein
MRINKLLGMTALLLLGGPLLALGDPTQDELDRNRRQFEEWRQDPRHLERLRAHAKLLLELPDDRRQKILRLDHDIHQEDAAHQARLTSIMDRYAAWLDRLDEKDRQRVKDAPDKNARVAVIRELRDRDWMKYQPKALRDEYARLQGDARLELVKKLRLDERQSRLNWQFAARFWKQLEQGTPLPSRLADFPADVNTYVAEYLRPMLSKEEEDRLENAQGHWPLYPLTLVELADKHPPALPGPKGPKSFAELPTDVKNKFKNKNGNYIPKLVKAEGRWPGFAIAVSGFAAGKKNYILPHELWASSKNCLSVPMQNFVGSKLLKVMNSEEKERLRNAEGKWPDYPNAIQDIASKHNLQVPWHTLPGLRERWDSYRVMEVRD